MSSTIKLSSPATKEFWEIPVLFEDEHLLALEKPAGLLTSPDRHDPERVNLMTLLHSAVTEKKPWARERNLEYLANAHRLDFETSGVLLLAKTKSALIAVADLFGADKPVQTYATFIWGHPLDEKFEVDAKIGPHPLKIGEMRVDSKDGKRAKSLFEVVEKFSDWSLVRCIPQTSRTHQLRVHLKYASFPVVGDALYGGKNLWLSRLKRDYRLKPGREEKALLSRVALHAEELSLVHPFTNETIVIKSEWPKDMRVALKYLRLYAPLGFGAPAIEPDNFE